MDQRSADFEEFCRAGVAQLVECNLSKVEAAGSSPASRSILFTGVAISEPARNKMRVHRNSRLRLIAASESAFKYIYYSPTRSRQ